MKRKFGVAVSRFRNAKEYLPKGRFEHWPLRTKLGCLFLLLSITNITLSLVGQFNLNRSGDDLHSLATEQITAVRNILLVDKTMESLRGIADRSAEAIKREDSDGLQIQIQGFEDDVSALESYLKNLEALELDSKTKSGIVALRDDLQTFCDSVESALMGDSSSIAQKQEELESEHLKNQGKIELLVDAVSKNAMTASDRSQGRIQMGIAMTWIFAFVSISIAGFFFWTISRFILRHIHSVMILAQSLSKGDLTTLTKPSSTDEIGQMARALNMAIENLRNTLESIETTSNQLKMRSDALLICSDNLNQSAQATSDKASVALIDSEEMSRRVSDVARASGDLSKGIEQIISGSQEAREAAEHGVTQTLAAKAAMNQLLQTGGTINNMSEIIRSIADKTDMLALNANIEASRAGDRGRGFAVVANEVKDLARQTTHATKDIARRSQAIRDDSESAAGCIEVIDQTISRMRAIQSNSSNALGEQTHTTSSIGIHASELAQRNASVTQTIHHVYEAAAMTRESAGQTKISAQDLSQIASELNGLVRRFKLS